MRALVQRVVRARVTVVDEETGAREETGSVGAGLCAFVGVTHGDTAATAARLAEKLWHLRILADDEGAMQRSAADTGAPFLVVSEFTLYGDTSRGRRPSWSAAARPEVAEPLIDELVAALRRLGAEVATGRFRTHMEVELVNDGPVTVMVEVE